jgi:trehalose 6-phosphate synthase/phosphatase
MDAKRLFIVANRLPVTVTETASIQLCSGGLVSAINSYLLNENAKTGQYFIEKYWVGVPGCSPNLWNDVSGQVRHPNFELIPIFTNLKDYDGYYNGFANSVLWPLFHYFPSYAEYNAEQYQQYQQVNEQFALALSKQVRPHDIVWIHDYHLLPLAKLLRKACPQLTIGFFLHIPFPSFEVFRLLPRAWQQELLEGLLGADLIGFHTIDYASHFLQSIQMVLGLDNEHHIIRHEDRLIKVDVFPISIDFKCFHQAYDDVVIQTKRSNLKRQFEGKKILFSIDRLDYTKGVLNRLLAYEQFLKLNPGFLHKVHMIVIVVPSRDTIGKYAERKRMINETISRINSRLGDIHWQPVIYQYTSLQFEEMLALYTTADVALVTPLRDGMNLIAKEYVASRKDGNGVLILSEMAGAARELTGALIINPNDVGEMADKIREALQMEPTEQKRRLQGMQARLKAYDVSTWAEDFIGQMLQVKEKQQSFQVQYLDEYTRKRLLNTYLFATRRLLLLDYDGTLVPFATRPNEARPSDELLQVINELCMEKKNDVVIISGRNRDFLEKWFGPFRIQLVAEHGAMSRSEKGEWASQLSCNNEWKGAIHSIMEQYVKRCAHTFIEVKEFSIVWHFRNAIPEQAKLRAAELLTELNDYTRHLDLQVLTGNKIIEVRKHGIHKGVAITNLFQDRQHDFILAAGDDNTDEDMFKALVDKPNCYTIKIGSSASFASYNLSTTHMMVALLQNLNYYKSHPVAD